MINSIKDLREENRDMFSSINEAIKLMLAVATNMSCVVENNIGKEESKDNLKDKGVKGNSEANEERAKQERRDNIQATSPNSRPNERPQAMSMLQSLSSLVLKT
ncbi:hypothetical protein Tco_1385197 [Tanacetum coccineum]